MVKSVGQKALYGGLALAAGLTLLGCIGEDHRHAIDEPADTREKQTGLYPPLDKDHQWAILIPQETAGRTLRIAVPRTPDWEITRAESGDLLNLKGRLAVEMGEPVEVTLLLSTNPYDLGAQTVHIDREADFVDGAGRHRRFSTPDTDGSLSKGALWERETQFGPLYFSATMTADMGSTAEISATWDKLLYEFRAVAKSLSEAPPKVFGTVGHSELIRYFGRIAEDRAKMRLTVPSKEGDKTAQLKIPEGWETFSENGSDAEISLSLGNNRIAVFGMRIQESMADGAEWRDNRKSRIGQGGEANARILSLNDTIIGSRPGLSYEFVDTRTVGRFPARHMTKRWLTQAGAAEIALSGSIFGDYRDTGIADDYLAFLPLFEAIVSSLEVTED